MRAHDSLKTQWQEGLTTLLRMWLRGCWVGVRLLLFAVLLELGATMIGQVQHVVERLADFNAWSPGTFIALIGGLALVALPMVIYVAASWVGLCPYVDRDISHAK